MILTKLYGNPLDIEIGKKENGSESAMSGKVLSRIYGFGIFKARARKQREGDFRALL
jgi:hypothetical protein